MYCRSNAPKKTTVVSCILITLTICLSLSEHKVGCYVAAFHSAAPKKRPFSSFPITVLFTSTNQRTNDVPYFADPSDDDSSSSSTTKQVPVKTMDDDTSTTSQFGQSIPYTPSDQPPSSTTNAATAVNQSDTTILLQQKQSRNIIVAILSFAISILHYIWQITHPVTAVELLVTMQSESASLGSIGNNGKPTVIDFWYVRGYCLTWLACVCALQKCRMPSLVRLNHVVLIHSFSLSLNRAPWCENCKAAAPTLKSIEDEYADRVNFIMVNGDDGRNWPLIQLFGVDAIPHLALLSEEGDVETALIGPMSRNVLRADIDALLAEKDCRVQKTIVRLESEEDTVCRDGLPYVMYDAFGNRPDSRRINFVDKWFAFTRNDGVFALYIVSYISWRERKEKTSSFRVSRQLLMPSSSLISQRLAQPFSFFSPYHTLCLLRCSNIARVATSTKLRIVKAR